MIRTIKSGEGEGVIIWQCQCRREISDWFFPGLSWANPSAIPYKRVISSYINTSLVDQAPEKPIFAFHQQVYSDNPRQL